MNGIHVRQVICIVKFDRCFGDNYHEGLYADAIPVGPDGWPGLLEAAKLQESDDEECHGFFVRAQAIDFITDRIEEDQCWNDLCQDQVERIFFHLGECHIGRSIESGP